jgi:AcrR family transcriptional regulator
MADVKGPPGQARKDRAKATRRRIVDCAYRLFCDKGYASTTMESIAAASGVAVQTVYYVFRTKAQLLQEVIEVAAAGQHDPLPVMRRPWMQEALTTSNGARSLALNVEHGVDIYARVAPLGPAVHMAASLDPDIETYWRAIADGRRRGMSQLVAHLAASGQLNRELTLARAGDILFVINSHETFLTLTHGCGWSVVDFKAWLYQTLCQQLLSSPAPHLMRGSPAPTEGLSYNGLVFAARMDAPGPRANSTAKGLSLAPQTGNRDLRS